MHFSSQNQDNNLLVNNADSFAMAFDEVWKNHIATLSESKLNSDEKIKMAFLKIKDHPFLINNPSEAIDVAKFRIRLLQLK